MKSLIFKPKTKNSPFPLLLVPFRMKPGNYNTTVSLVNTKAYTSNICLKSRPFGARLKNYRVVKPIEANLVPLSFYLHSTSSIFTVIKVAIDFEETLNNCF